MRGEGRYQEIKKSAQARMRVFVCWGAFLVVRWRISGTSKKAAIGTKIETRMKNILGLKVF